MKIAIDARSIHAEKHGIARYTENLIRHLPLTEQDQLSVIFSPTGLEPWNAPQIKWIPCHAPLLSLQEQVILPLLLRRIKPDIFHSPSFVLPWAIPCPWVITLHDLIHVNFSENYSWKHRLYYRWLKKKLKTAAGILTVSQYSCKDILNWLAPLATVPVQVTYPGVSDHFQPAHDVDIIERYGVEPPYLLFVGNPKPHKNFELLYKAFLLLSEKHGPTVQLVTIGIPQRDLPENIPIQFLKAVPEQDLPALYSSAEALLCPSLSEGFGFPALEAMACGTSVIASKAGSLPEVVGDAGLLFSPLTEMALIESIEMMMFDRSLARYLRSKSLERAEQFSWTKMAAETYAFYQNSLRQ